MIMSVDLLVYISVMTMSCVMFSLGFTHVLKVLMSLEFVVISSLMMLIYTTGFVELGVVSMYFMIIAVCDAIIGLSLMILMVRFHGNEYTKSIMIGKW